MRYKIIYNGSKFAGEEPDDILQWIERLKKYTLEEFSDVQNLPDNKGWVFLGNFMEVSGAFKIEIYDAKLQEEILGLYLAAKARGKLKK